MPRKLLTATLAVLLAVLIGWILYIGQSLLLPFVIAVIAWYIIDMVARAIASVQIAGYALPRFLAFPLALVLILAVVSSIAHMVMLNIAALAADAPFYQARLESKYAAFWQFFDFGPPPQFYDLLPDNFLSNMLSGLATFLTTVAGSAALVAVYMLFLLIEQSTFEVKFRAMFESPAQLRQTIALRTVIQQRVQRYVSIKTAVSAATGLLTSGILVLAGLPYAAMFGFVAFLLNFIPTVGSMIAVILPSLFALVYVDEIGPFLIVVAGLGGVQFVIGNIVEPRLMGNTLNLSGLGIMFALSFWGAIWGVTGMALSVPITVVAAMVFAQFPATRPIAVLLSADGVVDAPIDTADDKMAANEATTSTAAGTARGANRSERHGHEKDENADLS